MNLKELGKLLGRDFLVAVFFILSVTGLGAIGNIIGLQSIQVNLGSLGTAIGTVNIVGLVWIFLNLVAVGILAIFWARASRMIGKILHIENKDSVAEPKHKYKTRIVAIFLYGILISVFIQAFSLFMHSINKNLDITNVMSLQQELITGNYLLLAGSIISMAVVGVIIIRTRKLYPAIESNLPKQLEK